MPRSERIRQSAAGASRACDSCHRMKIRCVDRSSPPCRRCSTMGIQCEFTSDQTSSHRVKSNQDRIANLELQMGKVHNGMLHMEKLLRRLVDEDSSKTSSSPVDWHAPLPTTLDEWVDSNIPSNPTTLFQGPSLSVQIEEPTIDDLQERSSNGDVSRRGEEEDDDDDFLLEAAMGAPMRDLLHKDEDERLRQETHPFSMISSTISAESSWRTNTNLIKRIHEPIPTQRGDLLQSYPDPIDLGFCTEEEGRRLFGLFFQGAHAFVPIFDPVSDTWESLRSRSSFCITAILMAGQIVADADGPNDVLREKFRAHAEKIAMATLFSPVASVEAIQAMIILANWGDTAWRPGNHMLSLALDMDLHLCLPYLAKTGMGRNKAPQELEKERSLVAGARVWLATCKTHTELCLNYARPILCESDESVEFSRLFLTHPLATPQDSRCVVICEVHAIREPLHRALGRRVPGQSLDQLIAEAMQQLEIWESYWTEYYSHQGFASEDFMVTELVTIKCYTTISVNAALLHGVKSKRDVQRLSDKRRQCLVAAVRAAAALVARAARGAENAKLCYGNRNVPALVPDAIDLRQAAKDVELLADQLARFPDFHFSQFLRHVVVEARRKRELPPTSALPSPRMGMSTLQDTVASHLDFSIADDVFATEDWMNFLDGVSNGQLSDTHDSRSLLSGERSWLIENTLPRSEMMASPTHGSNPSVVSQTGLPDPALDADVFPFAVGPSDMIWDPTKKPFWLE
ncbi:hypothetical protein BCR39DRAFT_180451 [Naematelia encephala]|uniref:Zn(2)-C6 fungal-type domain-containing protein n=1 Tax=Naematelia encephala TaxID=71784 RepID=A0A1Y2B2A4_9TREE|nr:hypothetical protein BCR39DRAFT_180451 [Naematelia encephala]